MFDGIPPLADPPAGLAACKLAKMDWFQPLSSLVDLDDLPAKPRVMAERLYDYACRNTPGASIPAGAWRKLARITDTTQASVKRYWPDLARVLDLTECTDGRTYAWVVVPVVGPLWERHLEKVRQGRNGANKRWHKTYSLARATHRDDSRAQPELTPELGGLNRQNANVFRAGAIATATATTTAKEETTHTPSNESVAEAASLRSADVCVGGFDDRIKQEPYPADDGGAAPFRAPSAPGACNGKPASSSEPQVADSAPAETSKKSGAAHENPHQRAEHKAFQPFCVSQMQKSTVPVSTAAQRAEPEPAEVRARPAFDDDVDWLSPGDEVDAALSCAYLRKRHGIACTPEQLGGSGGPARLSCGKYDVEALDCWAAEQRDAPRRSLELPADDASLAQQFDELWKHWPIKSDRESARRAYTEARREATADQILAAARAWIADLQRYEDPVHRKRYCGHLANWISKGRYHDRKEAGALAA